MAAVNAAATHRSRRSEHGPSKTKEVSPASVSLLTEAGFVLVHNRRTEVTVASESGRESPWSRIYEFTKMATWNCHPVHAEGCDSPAGLHSVGICQPLSFRPNSIGRNWLPRTGGPDRLTGRQVDRSGNRSQVVLSDALPPSGASSAFFSCRRSLGSGRYLDSATGPAGLAGVPGPGAIALPGDQRRLILLGG